VPSNKPRVLQTAVIAKAAIGESKSQIARDLDMTRNTVNRILDASEFNSLVDGGKSNLYQLIPEAVDVYGQRVKKNALEAKDFLERVSVLPAPPQAQNVNNGIVLNFRRDTPTPAVQFPTKPEV